MNRVRRFLLHGCVVCSLVCVTAKILDWYNPYMDFTGHIWGIQMALYLSVIVLAVTKESTYPMQRKRQVRRYLECDNRRNYYVNPPKTRHKMQSYGCMRNWRDENKTGILPQRRLPVPEPDNRKQ